jgi:hypothetical protein
MYIYYNFNSIYSLMYIYYNFNSIYSLMYIYYLKKKRLSIYIHKNFYDGGVCIRCFL